MTSNQIDFTKREGEPLRQKVEVIKGAMLNANKWNYNGINLRYNFYQTFDALLNLEWSSLEGAFFDMGHFSNTEYPV